jgi:hypothetical protein
MKNRTALVALLASILAAPAGRASTPCDALPSTNKVIVSPEKIGDALCNACVGVPVPGARDRFGNGLDYNDGAKHWECEMMVGNRGNGQCKRQTTCLPGGDRFDDHGVFRCRYPAVVATAPNTPANPREACERGLKISITRVKNLDGLALTNNVVHKSAYPVKLLLEGDGVANGVSASIGGGIGVSVGDAARRLGASPSGTCLPPNCQVVQLDGLANAPTGHQTLTLYTPHQYASASVGLYVDPAPVPVVLGAPECDQPAKTVWAEIQLSSNTVGPGQTVSSNRVLVTVPPLAAPPGQPPTPRKWTLMLYQSDLQSVSPATFTGPVSGPVTFSYTARPAPPSSPAPALPPGSMVKIITDHGPATRRCVWARLTTDQGSVVVAAPVRVTP